MSYQGILSQLPAEERRRYLEDNADQVLEDYSYTRRLSEEELEEIAVGLGKASVEIAVREDQKKEYLDRYKEAVEPFKRKARDATQSLRTKTEEITGLAFEFKDLENGMIETYGEDGQLIGSRRMRPDEDNGRVSIFRMRDGTND